MSARTTLLSKNPKRGLAALACALLAFGCDGEDGKDGKDGKDGDPPPTDRNLGKGEDAPGVDLTITGVSGGSGSNGRFKVGDKIKVTFTIEKDDGSNWALEEMDTTRALVSGPTFNYQPIIYQVSDVGDEAVKKSGSKYTYTFSPIPAAYLPPLNDTPSFGPDDGELAGQPLLDGTYTVGMYFGWNYTAGGSSFRDVGDATFDFLIGGGATFESREVVTRENCNQCHTDLQFHGGLRRATTLCLLCHTAGSEDRNDPSVAGGTPGVTVDFKVMVHKIHNGAHLASVLGVTTDVAGDRDYAAPRQPYQLVGFGNNIHDYSDVKFPAWPNLTNPMPRDTGYAALGATEQALEDTMREGVTSCYLCHGDPDGAGPIEPPAQGGLAFSQPSRNVCGSCHDDWVFDRPYTSNAQTMPPQLADGNCTQCHGITGSPLDVQDGHLHPLVDPSFAEGVNIDIQSVDEAGTNDGDGTVDPGERIQLTFTIQDDLGADVDPASLSSVNTGLSGPTSNYNGFQFPSIPTELLTGPQPFTINLPGQVFFEYQGDATAGADVFTTNLAPHLDVAAAPTEVYERTGAGAGSSQLSEDVVSPINYIDVDDPTGFDRDDFIVIDDGGANEYLQIQWVDGDRLWFSSPQTTAYPPGPQVDHSSGASVDEVLLTLLTEGAEYTLDAVAGTITETGGFGNGNAIVVCYTSDFEMPGRYPLALNAGPDLTEVDGGWSGKSLVDGTYSLAMWARRNLTLNLVGETNSYPELAPGARFDFLAGDATTIDPYDLISSPDNCYACHVDLAFHGNNRRGWESCLSCHGGSATGDRTRYVAANAPETDGVKVDFYEMLHKLHMGKELTNPSDYVVVGFGFGYPNNFSENTFETIGFPAMPSGVKDCNTCHGNTAWYTPSNLNHPTEQVLPVQEWGIVCASCHDSTAASVHIESNTSPTDGAEGCTVCHDPGREFEVEVSHMVR